MDLKHRVLFLMALSSSCVYESRSFSPVEVRVGGLEGGACEAAETPGVISTRCRLTSDFQWKVKRERREINESHKTSRINN